MKLNLDESLFEYYCEESKYSGQNKTEKQILKRKVKNNCPQLLKYFDKDTLFKNSVLHHPYGHKDIKSVTENGLDPCILIPNDPRNDRYSELMHKMIEYIDNNTDFNDILNDLANKEVIVYKNDDDIRLVKLKDSVKELYS